MKTSFLFLVPMADLMLSEIPYLSSVFRTFQKTISEGSVKKFQNDFLETSYPSKY